MPGAGIGNIILKRNIIIVYISRLLFMYRDKMQTGKGRFLILLAAMALSLGLLLSSTTAPANNHSAAYAQRQVQGQLSSLSLSNVATIQNTSMSQTAPKWSAGNNSMLHQIVVGLPLRQDGKIWVGTVTFTASKPIEVEIEQKYNPKVIPDGRHGAPYNGKWLDNTTQVAVAPMTMLSNTPVIVTNTPISTGSFVFAGSALLFHKTDGFPFTVTYTIDAVAKPITQK
jgi:hypothetical protein